MRRAFCRSVAYTRSLKKVPLSGGAYPYRALYEVSPKTFRPDKYAAHPKSPYLTMIITPSKQTRKNRTTFQDVPLLPETEMPTTGDLKPGDSLFCTTPPIVTDPPSPDKSTHTPNYDIGIYEVLHEVRTIKILFHDCNDERIFVSDLRHAKMPQRPYYE